MIPFFTPSLRGFYKNTACFFSIIDSEEKAATVLILFIAYAIKLEEFW
jgi:hypothetical protein